MNVLIPMAGAGSRFTAEGYTAHKPVIPLSSRHSTGTVPMVVEAVYDLPVNLDDDETQLLFIVRDFHIADGVDKTLLTYFPKAKFIAIDALTEGQASTCLLARAFFDTDAPLMIAACDNGMDLPIGLFETLSMTSDALIFTFSGNEAVLQNPKAYGWVRTNEHSVIDVSIKQPVSDRPLDDQAIVGTFWFKSGHAFFEATDRMIEANDRINGEFYVDQVFKYLVDAGKNLKVLPVSKYICWGTPKDYETYQATFAYWENFTEVESWAK